MISLKLLHYIIKIKRMYNTSKMYCLSMFITSVFKYINIYNANSIENLKYSINKVWL